MPRKIIIKDNIEYEILVDSKFNIIYCNPPLKYLLFKDFRVIFEEYKDKVWFSDKGEVDYPLVVEEDVLGIMRGSNKAIDLLVDKFKLEI